MNRFAYLFWPRAATRKHSRARPVLELLEDRTVLNAYTAATVSDLIADINLANQAGGSNTITLTAPTTTPYTLTALENYVTGFAGDLSGNGLPAITAGNILTIQGNGDSIARSTASGTPEFRLLYVASGASLTLANVKLQGGVASEGGAILNRGTLDLKGVSVQNNIARVIIANAQALPATGGGIYSTGSLTLEAGTLVCGNQAIGLDAYEYYDWWSPYSYSYSTNSLWPASHGQGGGLYVAGGTVSLTDCTVSSNSAQGGAGWVAQGGMDRDLPAASGSGGGLYVAGGTVTLSNAILFSNKATGGAGGSGLAALVGEPGAGAYGGTGYGGALDVEGGAVSLTGCSLSSNTAVGGVGGVIYSPSGSNGRTGGSGLGGGLSAFDSTVTLKDCSLMSNTAVGGAGGSAPTGTGGCGGQAEGGGLFVVSYTGATVSLTGCSLSSNTAVGGAGGSSSGTSSRKTTAQGGHGGWAWGGGIFDCTSGFTSTLTLAGCSLTSNTAVGGAGGSAPNGTGGQGGDGCGGAVYVWGEAGAVAVATFSSDTMTGNSARGGQGGAGSSTKKTNKNGRAGVAAGGGLWVNTTYTTVYLDAFTFNHTAGNSPDNIYGPYSLIS